jgi:hypothetical protein
MFHMILDCLQYGDKYYPSPAVFSSCVHAMVFCKMPELYVAMLMDLKSEILTALVARSSVFWVIPLCSPL